MPGVDGDFLALEKHRLQLERNVKQLQTALQHWQTWDAEYEALKEEVEAVPSQCTPDQLRKIHAEFQAELLVGKEIDQVFGSQGLESRDRIINLLQRRIDYVGKNVSSLEKQLQTAENKYAAATVVSLSDAADDDGQPITEIFEELDDQDNVVSYHLYHPGDSFPQGEEALVKAGLRHLASQTSEIKVDTPQSETTRKENEPATASSKPSSKPTSAPSAPAALPAPSAKKSVSFSEAVQAAEPPPPELSVRAKRIEHIMKTAKEQENMSKEEPVVPEDEDEEDATLRRQMLQYTMGEVGTVVAEIELEEEISSDNDSGFEYGDDDFEPDFDDMDDDDDEEDEYGRFTGRVVTEKYHRRMLQLERKLGVKSRFTKQAERGENEKEADDQGGIGRIVVKHGTKPTSSASRPRPSKSNLKERTSGKVEEKKGVRFAQALDISSEAETKMATTSKEPLPTTVGPLNDVVERTTSTKTTETRPAQKPSRFKKARDGNAPFENGTPSKGPFDVPAQYTKQDERGVPTGPQGSTIADRLIERDPSTHVIAPDEFDDTMAHQEVADEYQRLRRKFIQRDGGFLKEDESVIQPLDENNGREPRSRFKAARLSRQ